MESLTDALERVVQWSEAYPLKVFPEPDWEEVKRWLGPSLLSRISASNMRHVVEGVGKIAKQALADQPENKEDRP